MTHTSDRMQTGNVFDARYPAKAVMSPVFVYTRVPIATYSNIVAGPQIVSGASFTLRAGTGISTLTVNNQTVYDLGSQRNLVALGLHASVAAALITVNGYEERVNADGSLGGPGQPLTETFTGPVGTSSTAMVKTLRYVRSITTSGNSVSGLAIGVGEVFGFPYKVADYGDVWITWAQNKITSSVGFTAAVTTTATAYTGDVRGTYQIQSLSANASRVFTAFVFVKDPDTVTGQYGVAQYAA